jgi:hypothetical protein
MCARERESAKKWLKIWLYRKYLLFLQVELITIINVRAESNIWYDDDRSNSVDELLSG